MRSRLVRALCQLACIFALSGGLAMLFSVSPATANGDAVAAVSTSGTPSTRPGAPATPTRRPPPDLPMAATPGSSPGTPAASPADATPNATPRRATPTPKLTPRATVLRQPAPLAVVLNGRDQVAEFTVVIAVEHVGPKHAGWHLTLQMGQFRAEGARVRYLPTGAISLTDVAISCASDLCAVPDNQADYPLAVQAGASRSIIAVASGDGYGDYVVTATFQVAIPANAYAGTYSGTAEVEVSVGR